MFAQPGTCTQSEKYAGCPFGQIKDWAGICFKDSEAKACPTRAPGSAAAAEKSSTSPTKIQAIKILLPAESTSPTKIQAEKPSTSPPRTCGLGPCLDFEKMKAVPRRKCNSSALKPTWMPSKSECEGLPTACRSDGRARMNFGY